jgi:hypothetical protein
MLCWERMTARASASVLSHVRESDLGHILLGWGSTGVRSTGLGSYWLRQYRVGAAQWLCS